MRSTAADPSFPAASMRETLVVLLSGLAVSGTQVHLDELEALALDAGDDLADVAVCHTCLLYTSDAADEG